MNAYVYAADLWCEDCAVEIRERRIEEMVAGEHRYAHDAVLSVGHMWDNIPTRTKEALLAQWLDEYEIRYDSSEYPKGPYPDGGGEADSPQHCGGCGLFLENPLTEDGWRYVRNSAEDFLIYDEGRADVIYEWCVEYRGRAWEDREHELLRLAVRRALEVMKRETTTDLRES